MVKERVQASAAATVEKRGKERESWMGPYYVDEDNGQIQLERFPTCLETQNMQG